MGYTRNRPVERTTNMELIEALELPLASEVLDADQTMRKRGIHKTTLKHFGVRAEFDQTTGRVIAHLFPITRKGEIVGFIRRDLRKKKKDAFSVIGEGSPSDCDLLGQHVAPKSAKKIWVVEGIYDYLSAWQALYESEYNKGRETPIIPAVVSIGFGTANAREHIATNKDFLAGYGEVIVCFDNDEATPEEAAKGIVKGKDATRQVALVLKDIKTVELDLNDPNEYLQEGRQKDLQKLLMFEAREYKPEFIVSGGVGLERLLRPLEKGIFIPTFPETSRLLQGFRPMEMTVVLAPSNVGKTSVCKEIGYYLIKSGKRVGHIFLEETIEKTQQSYLALDNNVPLPRFRSDPLIVPQENLEKSYKDLIDNDKTMWLSHHGSINPRSLIEMLEWFYIKGMEFVILDHISMVFSGSRETNERKEIDNVLTELAAFVVKTNMHIIVVSHIKRLGFKPPKNKDGNTRYPYWIQVEMDDARGSGAFEQLAWNVISIEPERLEGGARGRIRTRVLKNREWGWLGMGDILTMHPVTGRLVLADNPDYVEDEK